MTPQLTGDIVVASSDGSADPEFILGTSELGADAKDGNNGLQSITLYEDPITKEIVSVLATSTNVIGGLRPGLNRLKVQHKVLRPVSSEGVAEEDCGVSTTQMTDSLEDEDAEEDEDEEEAEDDDDDDDIDRVDELEDDDDIEQDDDDQNEDGENGDNADKPKMACTNCPGLLLTEHELTIHSTFHKDGQPDLSLRPLLVYFRHPSKS